MGTSVNNERRRLRSHLYESQEQSDASTFDYTTAADSEQRRLRDYNTPDLPDDFAFDYAIDGKITTLTKDQFLKEKKQVQRVVETITILDDPNFTSESKDVEIAIRLRGCGRSIVFGVSHVY